jgi:hypothetical protein
LTILIGADPEVFLRSKSTKDYVSAHGLFKGTKEKPVPLGNYGFMQVDGHALEFNINPASNEDEFVLFTTKTFDLLKGVVNDVDDDLEIALDPVANFDPDYFESLPVTSKVLGCTPDFSSFTGEQLDPPDISAVPLRTSSGHIHIGWTNGDNAFDPLQFAMRQDVARRLTPHLLRVSQKWETDRSEERRMYYGREGSFRPKPYGVELRALDCLWLASEDRMREVYRATVDGFMEEFRELAA